MGRVDGEWHGAQLRSRERSGNGQAAPRVAVVIVSFNTSALLRDCLRSVGRVMDLPATEVIVVDNASTDDSVAMLRREFPNVQVLVQAENLGFGAANNLGVQAASAPYIMLLNSDTVLSEDTAARLICYLEENPGVCCVAPRIILPSGRLQPSVFGHQPTLWRLAAQAFYLGALRVRMLEGVDGRASSHFAEPVGWVSGVCMVMRLTDFLAVSGFDPNIFMYCEDVDLCFRLAQGGRPVMRLDCAPVMHRLGGSTTTLDGRLNSTVWAQRNMLRLVRQRAGPLASAVARLLVFAGLAIRVLAGFALTPRDGLRENFLLRSSLVRLRYLLGLGKRRELDHRK